MAKLCMIKEEQCEIKTAHFWAKWLKKKGVKINNY